MKNFIINDCQQGLNAWFHCAFANVLIVDLSEKTHGIMTYHLQHEEHLSTMQVKEKAYVCRVDCQDLDENFSADAKNFNC